MTDPHKMYEGEEYERQVEAIVKAREWWIETHESVKGKKNMFGHQCWPQVYEVIGIPNTVHVIEKQAYDKLERENERLMSVLKSLSGHGFDAKLLDLLNERDQLRAEVEMLQGKLVKFIYEDSEELKRLKAELEQAKGLLTAVLEQWRQCESQLRPDDYRQFGMGQLYAEARQAIAQEGE